MHRYTQQTPTINKTKTTTNPKIQPANKQPVTASLLNRNKNQQSSTLKNNCTTKFLIQILIGCVSSATRTFKNSPQRYTHHLTSQSYAQNCHLTAWSASEHAHMRPKRPCTCRSCLVSRRRRIVESSRNGSSGRKKLLFASYTGCGQLTRERDWLLAVLNSG